MIKDLKKTIDDAQLSHVRDVILKPVDQATEYQKS